MKLGSAREQILLATSTKVVHGLPLPDLLLDLYIFFCLLLCDLPRTRKRSREPELDLDLELLWCGSAHSAMQMSILSQPRPDPLLLLLLLLLFERLRRASASSVSIPDADFVPEARRASAQADARHNVKRITIRRIVLRVILVDTRYSI